MKNIENIRNTIICGRALTVLTEIPTESIDMCVTSPPYYGLRNYQVDNQIGLEKTPEEYTEKLVSVFREVKRVLKTTGVFWLNLGDSYAGSWGACSHDINRKAKRMGMNDRPPQSFIKSKRMPRGTGRWGGGNVPATGYLKPKDLIGIPWRVAFALQKDGWYLRSACPWIKRNCMPESVSGSQWVRHRLKIKSSKRDQNKGNSGNPQEDSRHNAESSSRYIDCPGCEKCTPNGYVLRMSAGRPSSALEYMFLFAKSDEYYFDMEPIRRAHTFNRWSLSNKIGSSGADCKTKDGAPGQAPHQFQRKGYSGYYDGEGNLMVNPNGRNYRNTDMFFDSWQGLYCEDDPLAFVVNPKGFKDAHFATFPEKLIEPCVLSGTSEKGVCPCGAPFVRIIDKKKITRDTLPVTDPRYRPNRYIKNKYVDELREGFECGMYSSSTTIGWKASCSCNKEPVRPIVLDPFMGAGTTALVAKKLNRDYIGIDLNSKYIKMAEKRIASMMVNKESF